MRALGNLARLFNAKLLLTVLVSHRVLPLLSLTKLRARVWLRLSSRRLFLRPPPVSSRHGWVWVIVL